MSAATIIYTDIVGFSKKPTLDQRHLVNTLTSEITYELRELLNPPMDKPGVIALPTGDGIALAFLHKPNQSWDRSIILSLIFRVQNWANAERTEGSSVNLRIGVHVGPVEVITDINGRPNVCGDTINFAQRVMDAANPRQVLFSDTAFREYIGNESPIYTMPPFSKDLIARFEGPIEVFAKHGLQIQVYKVTLEPPQEWWSNEDPTSKGLMIVSLTPLPKEIVGSFSEYVSEAQEISFIQLTGDRFLKNFNEKKIAFSQKLKRFWVFMPEPESYSHLHLSKDYPSPVIIKESISKWTDLLSKLKQQHQNTDLKLGLFKEPPYIGASFIDWQRPGGRIHISPYLWNVPTQNCPGYDLQWIGKKPSPIYEVYAEALQYINSQTTNTLLS